MEKKEIRGLIRTLTNTLTEADKAQQAHSVTEQLRHIIIERKPEIVAAFMPLSDEIAIDIANLSTLCRIVIPRITSDKHSEATMEFYDYNLADISAGAYGIDEPQGSQTISADMIDMMILPGVAFTSQGDRLGRGKGFYDRYTSRKNFHAYCIGVCYKHQVLDKLPTESHDRGVNDVITAQQ